MVFGVPDEFVSDAGPQMLRAKELVTFCQYYGINARVGVPYSPKSHGRIEISNRTITDAVSVLAEQFQVSWTRIISLAVLNLNLRPRKYFGALSPYNILFGETYNKPSIVPSGTILNVEEHRELQKALDAKVAQLVRNAQEDMARINERLGGVKTHISPGTLVLLKNFRIRNRKKTQPKYMNVPSVVLHDYGYSLLVQNYAGLVSIVHKSNIKIAREREITPF